MSIKGSTSQPFKDVPTVIFQIIQEFLSLKDYSSLMNCSKAIFADIKYETIVYHYKLEVSDEDSSDEGPSNRDLVHGDVSMFHHIVTEKVKDRSKQIIFTMYLLDFLDVEQYIPPFQGMYKLSLDLSSTYKSVKTFDFGLFDNICDVKLSNMRSIESIVGGFAHIKILELISFPKLKSITNINSGRTLHSMRISDCGELEEFDFPVESLTCFTLWDPKPIPFIFQLIKQMPRVKDLVFYTKEEDTDSFYQELSNFPIDLSLLHNLDLWYPFPLDLRNVTMFENILHLALQSTIPGQITHFNLSRFLGRRLDLSFFNVSLLIETMANDPHAFKSLRVLVLRSCSGVIHFPSLPELKELSLWGCKDLVSISSLKKLRYLRVSNSDALTMISADQPALRDCAIIACNALTDLSFAAGELDKLLLNYCKSVEDVSMLRRVKSLTIIRCSKITSLAVLSGDPLPILPDEREIILQGMSHVKDLPSLRHIGSLRIE